MEWEWNGFWVLLWNLKTKRQSTNAACYKSHCERLRGARKTQENYKKFETQPTRSENREKSQYTIYGIRPDSSEKLIVIFFFWEFPFCVRIFCSECVCAVFFSIKNPFFENIIIWVTVGCIQEPVPCKFYGHLAADSKNNTKNPKKKKQPQNNNTHTRTGHAVTKIRRRITKQKARGRAWEDNGILRKFITHT